MHRIVSDCQTGEIKYYDEQDNEIPAPEPAPEPAVEQPVEAPEVSDGGQE